VRGLAAPPTLVLSESPGLEGTAPAPESAGEPLTLAARLSAREVDAMRFAVGICEV
jgi:hypothetical protein